MSIDIVHQIKSNFVRKVSENFEICARFDLSLKRFILGNIYEICQGYFKIKPVFRFHVFKSVLVNKWKVHFMDQLNLKILNSVGSVIDSTRWGFSLR